MARIKKLQMAKGKQGRMKLESKIQQMLSKDNGVMPHFDYHIKMNPIS